MTNTFFAYISRMKNIKRWGLMPSSREENVAEHSLQVAMIAHALAVIQNTRFGGDLDAEHIMALAVYHETSEVITGDLVTPIKYFNEEITSAYKKIEKVANEKMLNMLPEDLQEEYLPLIEAEETEEGKKAYRYVKAADKIAAYTKCLEELRSGNQEFSMAKKTLEEKILAMENEEGMEAVKVFMEEFIPSFMVTLDELNAH